MLSILYLVIKKVCYYNINMTIEKQGTKMKRVTMTLNANLMKEIESYFVEEGIKVSPLVNKLLKEWLEEQKRFSEMKQMIKDGLSPEAFKKQSNQNKEMKSNISPGEEPIT